MVTPVAHTKRKYEDLSSDGGKYITLKKKCIVQPPKAIHTLKFLLYLPPLLCSSNCSVQLMTAEIKKRGPR